MVERREHPRVESAFERMQEVRDRAGFQYMMEAFFTRWSPADRYEASMFNADLMSLVRQIHIDATTPLTTQLTEVFSRLPLASLIAGKPVERTEK